MLWKEVRNKKLEFKFFRQYIFDDKYILDFYCPAQKLVIEIDGGQHNDREKDKIRDEYLTQRGCKVIRFWNNEVLENIEGCLIGIINQLNSPNPS